MYTKSLFILIKEDCLANFCKDKGKRQRFSLYKNQSLFLKKHGNRVEISLLTKKIEIKVHVLNTPSF